MADFLDYTGLQDFWTKVKQWVLAQISAHTATVVQTVTSGTKIGSVDGTDLYAPASGGSLPSGGAADTFLAKNSAADQDAGWRALATSDIPDLSGAYLPLTGGTLSGNENIEKAAPMLYLRDTGITLDTSASNQVTSNGYPGIKVVDSNDQNIGVFEVLRNTSGSVQTRISARDMDTSGNMVSNHLYLTSRKNGDKAIAVSDPDLWREALDVPQLGGANEFADGNQFIVTPYDTSQADNGLSSNSNRYFAIKDGGDRYVTWLGAQAYTNGNVVGVFGARNYGTGSQVSNYLQLGVSNSGTRSVTVSEAAPWRNALGLTDNATMAPAHATYLGLSSSYTCTTSSAKLALSTFSGENCTASSNGIKVTNAGTYLIWGDAYMYSGYTAGDIFHLEVKAGSTTIGDCLKKAEATNPYETCTVGPIIHTAAAGTVFYLYCYNQNGARGTVASRAYYGLHLVRIA